MLEFDSRHSLAPRDGAGLRFFLAGIMQGSHLAATLHPQGYRQHLKQLLGAHFPGASVYDPLADHADSLAYTEEQGRRVFFDHCRMCREVDVLLAFAPQASMGTAIEMWEAYQNGRAVITVSPMSHNWVVKFLSHAVYADLEALERALADGTLAARIDEVLAGTQLPVAQAGVTQAPAAPATSRT